MGSANQIKSNHIKNKIKKCNVYEIIT